MTREEADLPPDELERRGLRLIAEGNRLVARALLRQERAADEWVDQFASPLGRRQHNEAARKGKLSGARKVKGHWLVRRDVLNTYIQKQGLAPSRSAAREDEDVDDVIQRVMTEARRR